MRDRLEPSITFGDALKEGIDQAMERDPRVILIGEGVPDPKAIFNTTAGLRDKYGEKRVFDMPLAENGITGICIGAALNGLRPIMVHQRIDFALLAMDQLINNAAKWHYMFDGKAFVPLVVRMIIGRGWGQGPQHSQSLQALFAQIPGLKVVMPTTAYDAKGMMIAAIEDNNPVIFIEHRWLHHVKDNVPPFYYRTAIDKARILRKGSDITIASFSYMNLEALIAAQTLSKVLRISVEIIDMRSVRPLDIACVMQSLKKTGRLLILDTAHRTGSVAAELMSQVIEKGFEMLQHPPQIIASPDYPSPTSHFMTEGYYPGPKEIADAVILLMQMSPDKHKMDELYKSMQRIGPHDTPNQNFTGPF